MRTTQRHEELAHFWEVSDPPGGQTTATVDDLAPPIHVTVGEPGEPGSPFPCDLDYTDYEAEKEPEPITRADVTAARIYGGHRGAVVGFVIGIVVGVLLVGVPWAWVL